MNELLEEAAEKVPVGARVRSKRGLEGVAVPATEYSDGSRDSSYECYESAFLSGGSAFIAVRWDGNAWVGSQVPEGLTVISTPVVLSFIDHHRQNYHEAVWNVTDARRGGVEAEFMVGDYCLDEGGVREGGEFGITLHSLRGGAVLTPKLEVFEDAMGALHKALEMGLDEVMEDTLSREDFGRRLIEIGITDRSDKELPPLCPHCGNEL